MVWELILEVKKYYYLLKKYFFYICFFFSVFFFFFLKKLLSLKTNSLYFKILNFGFKDIFFFVYFKKKNLYF